MRTLRKQLYFTLEPPITTDGGLSWLNKLIIAVILASVAVVVVESEPAIMRGGVWIFQTLEVLFGVFFATEYLVRVWVSVEDPRYADGWRGRLRYMLSVTAMLDLVAALPPLLLTLGTEAYVLRIVRMVRVLRLSKLGRFSSAIAAISEAIRSRSFELLASVCFALVLLLVSSTMMYLLEAEVQPDHFGSIPRAMWWSVVTLTTVGYGDAYPITAGGRVVAGITAITGIGLIAMPTGILAAAFSDALHTRRKAEAPLSEMDETNRRPVPGAPSQAVHGRLASTVVDDC